MAQKWADQCTNVDYKGDQKRRDPVLFHDTHAHRKTRELSKQHARKIFFSMANGESIMIRLLS